MVVRQRLVTFTNGEGEAFGAPLQFSVMFFCIQIPLTDLRLALPNESFRLNKPSWPYPDNGAMLRYFGATKLRTNGGVHQWSDENYICNGRRAIRIVKNGSDSINLNKWGDMPYQVACRRFNSNGKIMAKYEFGIYDNLENLFRHNSSSFEKNVIVEAISKYADIEVRVPNVEGTMPLLRAGKALQMLYLKASTKRSSWKNNEIEKRWVQSGEPVIIAVCEETLINDISLTKNQIHNKSIEENNIKLFCIWVQTSGNMRVRTWVISVPEYYFSSPHNPRDSMEILIRGLRLNLFRINAEKEALRQLLNSIKAGIVNFDDHPQIMKATQKLLKKLTKNLLKKTRYSIDQKDVLNHALKVLEIVQPGEIEQLKEEYDEIFETINEANQLKHTIEILSKSNANYVMVDGDYVAGDKFKDIKDSIIINRSKKIRIDSDDQSL